jgi:hypothetical protein
MGQRANLIILKNNKYDLYYDHWCANSLDAYLFWGVKSALKFFRSHEKQNDDWWLDTVWCEGGAVIDLDKKVLLWFGGEDISFDIVLRRTLLELMQKNWKGYTIRWAYRGVVDLAQYVGYDTDKVMVPFDEKELFTSDGIRKLFENPVDVDYWNSIISIRNENNVIELYITGSFSYFCEILYYGEKMLQLRQKATFYDEYVDDNRSNELKSGIHIDLILRELHVWSADIENLDGERLRSVWPDYKIHNHNDRFEVQSELTDGKLRFIECNRKDLFDEVKGIVCRDEKDLLDTLNSLISRLSEEEKDVKVSFAAFIASQFQTSKINQEKLFEKRFGKMRDLHGGE